MERSVEPDVLRDDVEEREECCDPEEPLVSRTWETEEKPKSEPTVEPRAPRTDAHGLAVDDEHARRRVMAEGEEHIVDDVGGPHRSSGHASGPGEQEQQGCAEAKQTPVAHSG